MVLISRPSFQSWDMPVFVFYREAVHEIRFEIGGFMEAVLGDRLLTEVPTAACLGHSMGQLFVSEWNFEDLIFKREIGRSGQKKLSSKVCIVELVHGSLVSLWT